MKNLYIISIFTLFLLGSIAFAASLASVNYPVAELGNCADQQACKAYCDQSANIEACLDYASGHGLMQPAEIEEAKKVLPYLKSGQTPGGCTSKDQCETYCSDDSHFEECISFAEKAGLVTAEDAAIARKVGGKGPGGCHRKEECEAYCQADNHFNECILFAEQHGIISPKEAEMARKVGSGGGPGGCKSETACRSYCEDSTHSEECINFAVQHGLIPPEEAEQAKKFMAHGGKGPGGCQGKEQCESYCKDQSHMSECLEFAHEIGGISEEDYQKAKQFGNSPRPGGCSSEAECTAYCQDPAHLPECTQFARSSGIQVPEGAGGMGGGGSEFGNAATACQQHGIPLEQCQNYCQSNPSACGISTGEQQGHGGEGYPGGEGNYSQGQQPPGGYQQGQYPQGQPATTGEQTPTAPAPGAYPSPSPTSYPNPSPTPYSSPAPAPQPAPAPAPSPTPISGAVTSFINTLAKILQGK